MVDAHAVVVFESNRASATSRSPASSDLSELGWSDNSITRIAVMERVRSTPVAGGRECTQTISSSEPSEGTTTPVVRFWRAPARTLLVHDPWVAETSMRLSMERRREVILSG